jgi:hypothetical protein
MRIHIYYRLGLLLITCNFGWASKLGIENHGTTSREVPTQRCIELNGNGYALVPSNKKQNESVEEAYVTLQPFVGETWETSTVIDIGAIVVGYELVSSPSGQKAARLIWLKDWPNTTNIERLGLSIELDAERGGVCAFHSLYVTANRKEKWLSLSTANSELFRTEGDRTTSLGEKVLIFPNGPMKVKD